LEGPVKLTFYASGESGAPICDLRVVDPETQVASARHWEQLLAYEDDKSATLIQPQLAAPL
jgi:hypothetical protein